MKRFSLFIAFLTACFFGPNVLLAQINLGYQIPAESIRELVEAPNTPSIRFNNSGELFLLLERPDLLSLEEVSQPVLGLAGLRINPLVNAQTVTSTFTGISINEVKGRKVMNIQGLPEQVKIGNISWSPDENWIAFSHTTAQGLELWLIDIQNYTAKKLSSNHLNATYGSPIEWSPDSEGVLVQLIPSNRGKAPEASLVPSGPIIQENSGKVAPSRTYQYLLQNTHDLALFDYYLSSQLTLVNLKGETTTMGKPEIYRNVSYSPDGSYILSQIVQKPYSYLVPIYSFPYSNQIWDRNGQLVKDLGNTASAETLAIGSDVVAEGPRNYSWRPDKPATLYYVEALDKGNPNNEVDERDAVFMLPAPFNESAKRFASTSLRYAGINWTENEYAILNERSRKSRMEKASLLNMETGKVIKVIADRSYEDKYADPGNFVYTTNQYNRNVLLMDKAKDPIMFTTSVGSSPEGDRPFLLKWNLISDKKDTLFKSQAPFYEYPSKFTNNGKLIISKESTDLTPNYYLVNLKNRKSTPITQFKDPYPSLRGVQKEQVSYKRKDGITLTATLYLPETYKKEDGPLPMLLWAYPREFKSAAAANQIKGSPYRFTRLSWGSPIYWVNRGYAILDNADMPIVGEGEKEPNDTFISQIQDNAEAAINYVAERGIVDPKRVAVGGHSYGAFMTANLLSHTNLFAAGLARSGAYNRTFTPFGFQAEERTYWQAPDVYYNMSPFSFADKIKTPILFIHGIDDENSGTFPIQSERLYNAIKGHGGTTRLVMLPKEFHGYRAKESILHTLWEMDQWLEKHVKNKK